MTSGISRISDANKAALDKLLEAAGLTAKREAKAKVKYMTNIEVSLPSVSMPQEKKLLAVKVWQEVTYIVRCDVGANVGELVADPMNRIARVGEGKVPASGVIEIRDATKEDLEAARPTKALVI